MILKEPWYVCLVMILAAGRVVAAPEVVFSTCPGGSACDQPAGDMLIDARGYIYLAGPTRPAGSPVTPGAFDPSFNSRKGAGDAFVQSGFQACTGA